MKKLSSIIILLLFSSISIAACPNKILGGYVGYQTKYTGTNTLSNIVNKVFVIQFTSGGTAKVLSTAKTSMAEPVGVQTGTGDNKNYLYNKSTCTLTHMKPLASPRQMKDAVREAAERGRSNF